jgi:bifunctional DNA-binding transcriptional regulator/antitoxin component of YhaV-PrlF toxin-antitoxin module
VEFRRKLYTRGSSYETTIPKPLLFALDMGKKQDVCFVYDEEQKRWYVEFEEREVTQ